MLWSGGKDSCLAFMRANDEGISIPLLATFVPEDLHDFQAHPRAIIERQARSMNVRHVFIPVAEPYERSYNEKLSELHDNENIDGVITGGIDIVANQPNWVELRCRELGLEAIRPLWKRDRLALMNEILSRKIEARISWISHPRIPPEWVGRQIDRDFLNELREIADKFNIDLCGENGEYHTIVTYASNFSVPIELGH